jgi:hypothetical protein
MSTPIIATPNTINSYAAWLEQPETDTNIESTFEDEDPMQLIYREHTLHIYSSASTWGNVTIYTITGRVHTRATVRFTNEHTTINLASLNSGIYIVSVTNSEGEIQTMKLSVE